MNDRYRYRVWDKEAKEYIYDAQDQVWFGTILDDDNYVVEQCTGLKDKNGKLIFEGHKVKRDDNWVGDIVWDDGEACYLFVKENGDNEYFSGGKRYEVIGNIHEGVKK